MSQEHLLEAIDGTYWITGRGLVVTGRSARDIQLGDEILIRATVRGIEKNAFRSDIAPGQPVGLLLGDLEEAVTDSESKLRPKSGCCRYCQCDEDSPCPTCHPEHDPEPKFRPTPAGDPLRRTGDGPDDPAPR